jgi:anti-sigma regulatory factor (Ser/Thr protein kinase)
MRTVESEIGAILSGAISEITQRSIFRRLGGVARAPLQQLSTQDRQAVQTQLESSVRLFAPAKSAELIASCARALALSAVPPGPGARREASAQQPTSSHKQLAIRGEKDIAAARLEAWSEAVRLGFSKFTSVKVATAVSELARNIVFYAGEGTVELHAVHAPKETRLEIVAADQGPGIDSAKLATIFDGSFRSERGMGKGLVAVQRLADQFHIDSRPGRGTRVSCVFRGGQ